MRAIAVLLCLCALFTAGCRRKRYENPITKDTEQPDKVLFDKAMKDVEKGRYEIARLTLNTLMNTYDTSEYMAKSKLLIADSWMREGGSHALAQAEAEYKDFILFYPTMEEAAESQYKICDIHYRQMEKPDRDDTHAIRAEEECRQLLTQFPNSRFAPQASQRLRNIQEVIAEREYRVGSFYHGRQAWAAAANRLHTMSEHYPLYSQSDSALMKLGESYEKMGPRVRDRAVASYQKVVSQYPLSALADEAKRRLKALEAEIPEPDPVAVARMKYEQENATQRGFWGDLWGVFSTRPDVANAAKSGQPASTILRPSTPLSVPSAAAGLGVTEVTVGGVEGAGTNPTALDTQPDARQIQPAAGTAPPGGAAAPAAKPEAQPASSGNARKQAPKKQQESKKKK
jgi:outer membrane protein assembly factor BamD